mmetsp:Transcript_77913/g.167163  ORF Transcript_77913/g.167163 Transcript_77913/m.167163 type:complete len:205 (+) Transcript_77913:187-801(+)
MKARYLLRIEPCDACLPWRPKAGQLQKPVAETKDSAVGNVVAPLPIAWRHHTLTLDEGRHAAATCCAVAHALELADYGCARSLDKVLLTLRRGEAGLGRRLGTLPHVAHRQLDHHVILAGRRGRAIGVGGPVDVEVETVAIAEVGDGARAVPGAIVVRTEEDIVLGELGQRRTQRPAKLHNGAAVFEVVAELRSLLANALVLPR